MAILRSTRRARARVLLVAAASGLAACSSSGGAAELTTSPSVTANGRHYAYESGTVARSAWPDACTLLTTDSAAAAIGTGVSTKEFHGRCFYVPGNDSFPTLTVTILGIGTDQRAAYDGVRDDNARLGPRSVPGVGRAAAIYPLRSSATVNLDVLAGQGLFEIALRYPARNDSSPTTASKTLVTVGKVLASEFGG